MISIIIPIYNVKPDYIDSCVQCALAQTVSDKEILIVNDGSTREDTLDFLKQLEAQEIPGVRMIHQDNGGLSKARYTGILEAKGDYITFFDGDDLMHKKTCERLLSLIGEHDMAEVSFQEVQGLAGVDIEEDKEWQEPQILTGTEILVNELVDFCGQPISWNSWAKLYRRSIFLKTYQVHENVQRGQDVVSLAEYLTACKSVIYTKDKLYYYNKGNEDSATKNLTWKSLTIADCWQAVYQVCVEKGFEHATETVGVLAAEAAIGAVVHAARRSAGGWIPYYSKMLRSFRKYKKKLSRINRLKLQIILYFPWIYYFRK